MGQNHLLKKFSLTENLTALKEYYKGYTIMSPICSNFSNILKQAVIFPVPLRQLGIPDIGTFEEWNNRNNNLIAFGMIRPGKGFEEMIETAQYIKKKRPGRGSRRGSAAIQDARFDARFAARA